VIQFTTGQSQEKKKEEKQRGENFWREYVVKYLVSKKTSYTICRQCGRDFPGNPSMRRCPVCRKKESQYRAQREKMKRSLPYYLKTDI